MHNKTKKRIAIEFIGGEPTLHPKLIDLFEKLSSIQDF
jgi:organic radical activating enzyme